MEKWPKRESGKAWEVWGRAVNGSEYLIGIFYGKTKQEALGSCRKNYHHQTAGLKLFGREVL